MSLLTGRTKESQQRDTNRLLSDPPALESLDITGITFTEPITAPTAEQLLLQCAVRVAESAADARAFRLCLCKFEENLEGLRTLPCTLKPSR
jgi:hypothetical protein